MRDLEVPCRSSESETVDKNDGDLCVIGSIKVVMNTIGYAGFTEKNERDRRASF